MLPLRGFAAAVDVEEECSQADEEQGTADHPDLVPEQGRDLLRRKEYKRDAENRGQQSTGAGEEERGPAILAFRNRLRNREPYQCTEHVNEWDQLQHHGQ